MKYKVLITTSGTGSRLGEITKIINKALVPINGRPTIEYVFDSYSNEIPFVVTLGYLGEQVREYLIKNHPNRKFEFVDVDKYMGEGSSLLYSMKCAKEKLQCPFVFHACDTIVKESIPAPIENWVIGYVVDQSNTAMDVTQYRSHKIAGGYLLKVSDKGLLDFDSIHVGLTGIHDYKIFWQTLEDIYQANLQDQSLSDVHIIEKLLENGVKFKWIPFNTWLDTGNLKALAQTEALLKQAI